MSAQALVQLISACIGILGSLFFAIGVMRQSVEAMARLSGSYWDWSPHLPPALAAQKADYLFGGGLIVLAFALQLMSLFASAKGFVLTARQASMAPWVAAAATVGTFFVLRFAAGKVAKYYERQVEAWIRQRKEKQADPT